MLTLLPSVALAQFYSLTYRNHATDCTALTDGKNVDLCFEEDSQNLYMCVPDEGDCSGSEWKLVDDEDTSSDDQTLSYNTTTDVITIEGGNTIDISEVDTTIADTTCDSGSCAVANTGTLDGYEASALLDNTDAQDLSLSTNTLSLSGDATTVDLSGYLDNTDTQLTEEQVEDFAGSLLGGTETRISVTYDDAGNAINFVVDDMLDNTDAQALSYNTTTNVISLVNGGTIDISEVDTTIADTNLTGEEVDDFVNALIKDADSVNTRITITYDDANNAFDFVVDDMLDNTDSQDLSYNTTTNVLSISGGDSVTLEEGGGITASDDVDWTGDHTFATTATFNSDIKSGTKLIKPDKPIAMFTITNGDTAIDASVADPVACVMIENDSIITEWTVIADKTGSIELDIWKDTYANHPPTVGDSIVGTEAPTISAGVKAEDTSLTSMTTDWNAGDVVCCAITSASTMTKATVQFRGYND